MSVQLSGWPLTSSVGGGRVRGTLAFQIDGQDPSLRPVADQEAVVILRRELVCLVESHSGGTSSPDVDGAREAVEVIRRPLARAVPPAELRADRAVIDAYRAIPGEADVPFHVAVEREELAIGVEGEVILVAESRRRLASRSCRRRRCAGSRRRVP